MDKTRNNIIKIAVISDLRVYGTARKVLRSILEDRNDIDTPHEAVINDHTAIISF